MKRQNIARYLHGIAGIVWFIMALHGDLKLLSLHCIYFFFFLSDLFCGAEVKSPFFPPLGGELAAASEDDSEHGIRPALPYFRQRQLLSVLHYKLCVLEVSRYSAFDN